MLRVVLTGGIASGKSAASAIFEDLGIAVIDADKVSRELVQPGEPALQSIVDHFGNELLDGNGRLDRAALRKRVFADDEERKVLQDILHPRIRERMLRIAEQAHSPYVILVVPLLVETDNDYRADRVLLIDAPQSLQLQRLQARDGCSEQQARQILAAQASREQRLAAADDVVSNDGDSSHLADAIRRLHRRYLAMSRR